MSDYMRRKAWEAGAQAARECRPETANNRRRGTVFYDDWADGWSHENNMMQIEIGIPAHERSPS